MSSYAVLNYQFAKIIQRTDETSLFPDEVMEMEADAAEAEADQMLLTGGEGNE